MRLLLASASPRRLELLAQIGIVPDEIRPAEVDETPRQGELPRQYCRRMALEKSLSIEPGDGQLVLAADTIVALGRSVLGKPVGEEEAGMYLRRLSGRRHRVVTAIALAAPGKLLQREVVSIVRMKRLTPNEIAEYVQSGEWRDKAGGVRHPGCCQRLHTVDQRFLFFDSRSAACRDLRSVAGGGIHSAVRKVKGELAVIDRVGGRDVAARLIDGQLEDLLFDPLPEDGPAPGTILRAVVRRRLPGAGGMYRAAA